MLSTLYGENLSNEIITKSSADGTVVFIKPNKIKRVSGSQAVKDMEYDVVLTSFSDTVTFTSTLVSQSPLSLDSVEVKSGQLDAKYPIEKLYVEPVGSKWESRVQFYMILDDFLKMSVDGEVMYLLWGNSVDSPIFRYDKKAMEKRSRVFRFAFEVINQNRD